AGAMLPKAYKPLEAILKSIDLNRYEFENVEFHFIGTGKSPDDVDGYNIKPLAEKYNLWQNIVFEYPKRIPYLDVLTHLNIADGIFILGSTEAHYTPSKLYQAVLSGKSILAVLHDKSSAVDIVNKSKGGMVFPFNGEEEINKIEYEFPYFFKEYKNWLKHFDPANVDQSAFNNYSAKNVTSQLVTLIEKSIS
ncbi:MAG TPA: hypothetical protein VGP55_01620, partial [Chitinophagaceae bacterium]|nr:hypothetical protein [Chitinophagaceae bacterium]